MDEIKEIAEINEKLMQIDEGEKLSFKLGSKTYKIARLNNWTMRRINKLIFKLQGKKISTPKDVYNSDDDRILIPQVISLAILCKPWKIKLFHGLFWRRLDKKYSQTDFEEIIKVLIDNSDMTFFSKNLASLHMAAMMETEITKETITTIAAKLNSEHETN